MHKTKVRQLAVYCTMAIATVGCTVKVASPPTTTVAATTTTSTSTTTTSTTTTVYTPTPLEGLTAEETSIWEGGTLRLKGDAILAFSNIICNGLRNGQTGSSMLSVAIDAVNSKGGSSTDTTYIARMIGATVRWMCPEMADRAKI